MNPSSLNLVVALSGASGALYASRFLQALAKIVPGTSSLIISPAALRIAREELNISAKTPTDYLHSILSDLIVDKKLVEKKHTFTLHRHEDIGARPASGSAPYDGMVVVPCSMKTLAGLAHGYTTNLIERAGDVALKERRKLIVVPRETPYSLVHLRNMTALTEAGATIVPASPGFYQHPASFDDLGDFIAGRILSLFGIKHDLFRSWQG